MQEPQVRLFEAARTNHVVGIRQALQENADLSLPNAQGESALIAAVKAKATEAVQCLLSEGADPHDRDFAFRTALHWAVVVNLEAVVPLLLQYQARVDSADLEGDTPLSLAQREGCAFIKKQLTQRAKINYHADQLALRRAIEQLTTDVDVVSEVRQQLIAWLTRLPDSERLPLDMLCRQLRQPESLLNWAKLEKRTASPVRQKMAATRKRVTKRVSLSTKEKPFKTFERLSQYPATEQLQMNRQSLLENMSVFAPLNALIETITALQLALSAKSLPIYQQIEALLTTLKTTYLNYREAVCQSSGESRLTLCEDSLRLRGFFGYRVVSLGASLRFRRFLLPLDAGETLEYLPAKDNRFGSHAVLELQGVYYKIRPYAPGIEQAVDSLNKLVSGQGSAPTELLMLEKGDSTVPVLASKAVYGENLVDVLTQHPTWLTQLDSFNYSAHVILTLLTFPTDAKPDNFIALMDKKKGKMPSHIKLVGIDNDMAFDSPILRCGAQTLTPDHHRLHLKSVFLCMSQMEQPIDGGFRQLLMKQSPVLLMLKWLNTLLHQERHYLSYQISTGARGSTLMTEETRAIMTQEEFAKLHLPIKFLPGTVQRIYHTLQAIQAQLRAHPKVTHHALLQHLHPLLATAYGQLRQRYPSVLEAIAPLYQAPPITVETLVTEPSLQEELATYSHTAQELDTLKQETLSQAYHHFINSLDYAQFDDLLQSYVLAHIAQNFPGLQKLTFRHCSALTDGRLEALAQQLPELQALTLVGCTHLDGAGLSAMLCQHPRLQITLEAFHSLSAVNLAQVIHYCDDLTFILPYSEESDQKRCYRVKTDAKLLLHIALSSPHYTALATALLLTGQLLQFADGMPSPLHLAAKTGQVAVVRELLRYGAPINLLNEAGQSVLDAICQAHAASENSNLMRKAYAKSALLLIKAGALPSRKPEAVLALLQALPIQTLLAARHALLTFVRHHHCLTPEWVPIVIKANARQLDLSPRREWMSRDTLTLPMLQAIHQQATQLETLILNDCQGLDAALLSYLLSWKLQAIHMDLQQAEACDLLERDKIHLAGDMILQGVRFHITQANFNHQPPTTDLLLKLGRWLKKSPYLSQLDLCHCQINPVSIKLLAGSLGCNQSLTRLFLNRNPLKNEGVSALVQAIMVHPTLTDLELDETGAGSESALVIAQLLATHPKLESLSLYGNPLGDEGIKHIAQGLRDRQMSKRPETLKRLILNQVEMGEDGMVMLTRVLLFHRTLVFLDVGYNVQVGNVGAQALIKLLESNPRLRECKSDELGADAKLAQQLNTTVENNRRRCQQSDFFATSKEATRQPHVDALLPPEYTDIPLLRSTAKRLFNQSPNEFRNAQVLQPEIRLSQLQQIGFYQPPLSEKRTEKVTRSLPPIPRRHTTDRQHGPGVRQTPPLAENEKSPASLGN